MDILRGYRGIGSMSTCTSSKPTPIASNVSYVSIKSADFHHPEHRRNASLPRSSRLEDRRQLPTRPSMDSSGNDSEETDVTSGSTPNQNNVSLDQISTMTLDEFKSLLNNALSVPNGNASEGSLDSPRSQSSSDSVKQTNTARSKRKPPLAEATQRYRTWANRKDVSRSFDTGPSVNRHDRVLKSTQPTDEYYELDRPAKRASAITRPKTPVGSVSRPKTPVSSVPRPKTPVSSFPTPKAPTTSHIRSTTPVNVPRPKTPVGGSVPRPSPGVTRQSSATTSVSRPKTPTRFQNSRVESSSTSNAPASIRSSFDSRLEPRSSSLNRTYSEQPRTEARSGSLSRISSDDRSGSDTDFTGTRTLPTSKSELSSDMPSTRADRIAEIRARLAASRYGTDASRTAATSTTAAPTISVPATSAPSTASTTSSVGSQFRKGSFDSASAYVSPKPEQTSPNVSYVSITSAIASEPETNKDSYFSETYQAMRQLSSGSLDTKAVSNSVSDASLSARSESSFRSSSVDRSYVSSRQSSLSSVDSSPKDEFNSVVKPQSVINRTQSLDECVINKAQHSPLSSQGDKLQTTVIPSAEVRVPRPSTPVRPSTPSFIPRPCTPLSTLKDSISNLEKQPAYSGQTAQTNSSRPPLEKQLAYCGQTTSGRPPAPRKAIILAKSPAATSNTNPSNKDPSYTKLFLAKRSSTPGPTTRSTTVTTPRRSRTPGPGDRDRSFAHQPRSLDLSSGDECEEKNTYPKARNVPESPVPPRNRRPSTELNSVNGQNSLEGETVLTVNRTSGRHVLSVGDSKTPRPTVSRILARAPSASQNQTSAIDTDRSRSRARGGVTERLRPRSVDPESAMKKKAEEDMLIVQRGENGGHVVSNRTEAWVESAAKNTKPKTPSKRLPPKSVYRRCQTPNPRDIHEHELESRPLAEIKAALSLPINGLKELDTTSLDAPPEDADAYAKIDELFRRLKEKELRASVNETPGDHGNLSRNGSADHEDSDIASGSLDSNENVKRKSSRSSYKSSPSMSNRGSVASTPTRTSAASLPPKSGGTTHQFTRANSMPPRPSTPTRSTPPTRRSTSNTSVHSAPTPDTNLKRTASDHTSMLVSKIKELINTKPRRDDKSGPRSRIPAPKSLSAIGKSKSVSNLLSSSNSENIAPDRKLSNGDLSKTTDYDDEMCGEISKYSSHGDLDYNGCNGTIRNGTETPVPKLATPLTTGRKEFLNNQRENTRTPKLVRAVSIGSLSSSSNTMSCTVGDDDEFV